SARAAAAVGSPASTLAATVARGRTRDAVRATRGQHGDAAPVDTPVAHRCAVACRFADPAGTTDDTLNTGVSVPRAARSMVKHRPGADVSLRISSRGSF